VTEGAVVREEAERWAPLSSPGASPASVLAIRCTVICDPDVLLLEQGHRYWAAEG